MTLGQVRILTSFLFWLRLANHCSYRELLLRLITPSDTLHSEGLLSTSDQPVSDTYTYTTHSIQKIQTFPQFDSNPQTHNLDQAATGTGVVIVKVKVIPRQAEVALGVAGRLWPRIFPTFGTTRVVGRHPNAPAAFTPGEIPGIHFQRLSRPQGTWFCQKEPRKKSPVTPPGIDPGTIRLVAQSLNHYATPGPRWILYRAKL